MLDFVSRELKIMLFGCLGTFLALVLFVIFVAKFPFPTLTYGTMSVVDPITRAATDKVLLGGVIHVEIPFQKFTDSPGLVIRTLIRKKGKEIIPLDSNTLISTRKAGEGIAKAIFPLGVNPELLGPDTYLVFTTYYNLFGFIPRMIQGEAGPFTIVPSENKNKPTSGHSEIYQSFSLGRHFGW